MSLNKTANHQWVNSSCTYYQQMLHMSWKLVTFYLSWNFNWLFKKIKCIHNATNHLPQSFPTKIIRWLLFVADARHCSFSTYWPEKKVSYTLLYFFSLLCNFNVNTYICYWRLNDALICWLRFDNADIFHRLLLITGTWHMAMLCY